MLYSDPRVLLEPMVNFGRIPDADELPSCGNDCTHSSSHVPSTPMDAATLPQLAFQF
jgi:hypothetical protein